MHCNATYTWQAKCNRQLAAHTTNMRRCRQLAARKMQHTVCNMHHIFATCNVAAQHAAFAVQQVLRPAVDQLEQLSAKALARISTVPPTCCIAL